MKSLVISLGGSVVVSPHATPTYLHTLLSLLQKNLEDHRIYVIVGGGTTAREYIRRGRELQLHEEQLDELGIAVTRVNALLLCSLIPQANKTIPTTTDAALNLPNSIIIMGGTEPGHSTDQVGAELASKIAAERFIIATNVDGIYTQDPREHPDAVKYDTITIDQLVKDHGTDWKQAGKNTVIDGPALSLIQQHRIPTMVINGYDLDEPENALKGAPIKGTLITT